MFTQKLTLVAILAVLGVQADQYWYSLKTTWGATPFQGFYDQPRTLQEALDAGWVQVSNDCSEGARYVTLLIFKELAEVKCREKLSCGKEAFG